MADNTAYDPNAKGSPYTAREILTYMWKGALYGIILFTVTVGLVWVLFAIGEWFLPRDVDAFLNLPRGDAFAPVLRA